MTLINITTDQLALLAFKAHIIEPQNSDILANNWSSTTSVCSWIVVTCGHRHQRVTASNITNMGLTGSISPYLGNLSFLTSLDISSNNFHGNLPEELAHLRRLKYADFRVNNFGGEVPSWFGFLPKLQFLWLANNSFTGTIPSSLFNISTLELLIIQFNRIGGKIPKEIGNLDYLRILNLEGNLLTGLLPQTIFNISTLQFLGLRNNSLSGNLQDYMCYRLPKLQMLVLSVNQLDDRIPTNLSECSQLQLFSLSYNKFSGHIPREVGNLTMLNKLALGGNQLRGVIPHEIGNLNKLEVLGLESNNLNGIIPVSIFNISTLKQILLWSNRLSGGLPLSIGQSLPNLEDLEVGSNNLTGVISNSISNASKIYFLELSYNKFSGSIPTSLGNLRLLETLSLGENNFVSEPSSTDLSFLASLANCRRLRLLQFYDNPLRDMLPRFIGNLLTLLEKVFAYGCGLKGTILDTIGNLSNLITLSLYGNRLTGFIALLLFVFLRHQRRTMIRVEGNLIPKTTHERISYYKLQLATDGFNESNLLGIGSFGSVYRGILQDGTTLAIKVFNLQLEGAFKSFDTECEILRNIRHRNLVKVISSCSNPDFKALVFEYMSNGSLEKWLYSLNNSLDMLQRLDIMIDAACALEYLHHGYAKPIVHCDLKPSNILLDEDMVAHVSDFGIAKLLGVEESIAQTMTLATFGYMAPEYGLEGFISTKCDVYSFGIVMMEILTRVKPSDDMFTRDLNLKDWVKNSLPDAIVEIVDADLLGQYTEKDVQFMLSIMELALNCTAESPGERMNIKDVLGALKKIRLRLLDNRRRI